MHLYIKLYILSIVSPAENPQLTKEPDQSKNSGDMGEGFYLRNLLASLFRVYGDRIAQIRVEMDDTSGTNALTAIQFMLKHRVLQGPWVVSLSGLVKKWCLSSDETKPPQDLTAHIMSPRELLQALPGTPVLVNGAPRKLPRPSA